MSARDILSLFSHILTPSQDKRKPRAIVERTNTYFPSLSVSVSVIIDLFHTGAESLGARVHHGDMVCSARY